MDFLKLLEKNRTYRKFDQQRSLSEEKLLQLIEYARRCASGGNAQPLRYRLVHQSDELAATFSTLKWAAALPDWERPEEGERPAAYIVILKDTQTKDLASLTDAGIAMQSILLGASDMGYGGCIIASVDKDKLRKNLNIPERYEILFVVALGVPAERVQLEEADFGDKLDYYRDSDEVHHVPKLRLDELIV